MYSLYFYCLVIGLIVLFLSLILDGVSDFFQGISFFDFHFDFLPGILFLSPLQICAFLVGFGGMGMTLYHLNSWHLLGAILCGALLYYATYFIISKLKSVNSETLTALDIIGSEAKVIVSIMPNSFGSVSLDTKNGKITYSAKSDHYIQQGQLVKIIDLKDSVVFVTDDPRYFLHKPSS